MARARYIRNKLKNLKMGRSAVGFISEAGELLGFYRGLRIKDPDNHELLENNKQIYKYIDLYQSKSTYQEIGKLSHHLAKCIYKKQFYLLIVNPELQKSAPIKSKSLEKVEIQIYSHHEKRHDCHVAKYKTVRVSQCFADKIVALYEERKDIASREIENKKEILKYLDKVFESRTFPPKLRKLIFERDNYTCQGCGITKNEAIREGKRLEVDHIESWYEGGLTTYRNGEILCSVCNTGKYHAGEHNKLKVVK